MQNAVDLTDGELHAVGKILHGDIGQKAVAEEFVYRRAFVAAVFQIHCREQSGAGFVAQPDDVGENQRAERLNVADIPDLPAVDLLRQVLKVGEQRHGPVMDEPFSLQEGLQIGQHALVSRIFLSAGRRRGEAQIILLAVGGIGHERLAVVFERMNQKQIPARGEILPGVDELSAGSRSHIAHFKIVVIVWNGRHLRVGNEEIFVDKEGQIEYTDLHRDLK